MRYTRNSSQIKYWGFSAWSEYGPGGQSSGYAGVRPIVTLKSNVIDISTDYIKEGMWKLK